VPLLDEVVARVALGLLSQIDDETAAEALRSAGRHSEARVRAAALRSLAWSGEQTDVPMTIGAARRQRRSSIGGASRARRTWW
jgi:HEAT repeat protein